MSPKKGPVRLSDRVYKSLSALLGGSAFLFLFLVIAVLLIYSYPSFIVNGVNFFTSVKWDPAISSTVVSVAGVKAMEGASYGMLVFFIGTLLSSGLALLIGAPLSLGVAIFLSTVAPKRLSASLSFFVELLAGI
ncbi:MAG: hypothetical protein JRM90_05835, partial [Nitrososphaerota archaeon]|nr:hypothetical protein [Nitrososphaerota archaeon]